MAQALQDLAPEPPASESLGNAQDLRAQLKAHLHWCAYLGASVDEEDMSELAALLRCTARTMRAFAEQAEQQARG